jgi:hypothetical protein
LVAAVREGGSDFAEAIRKVGSRIEKNQQPNPVMKTFVSPSLCAALALGWCSLAPAQVAVTETTTTRTGTIAEYAPNERLIVRSENEAAPLRYTVTERTAFVDETGAPLVAERIVPGVPIRVQYALEGDTMVASRVIVSGQRVAAPAPVAPATVTSTVVTPTERPGVVTSLSGAGTITEYSAGSPNIVLRSTAGAAPLTYAVSSGTTFVDESGAPVAVERIAPGVPVTVQYVREGDRMVASRVVVVRELPRTEVIEKVKVKKDDDDDD